MVRSSMSCVFAIAAMLAAAMAGNVSAASISDNNLFRAEGVQIVSSSYADHADYGPWNANDGLGVGESMDLVFAAWDGSMRMVVHGFDSAVAVLRLWGSDLCPLQVMVKSSTTDTASLDPADYETTLIDNGSGGYVPLPVPGAEGSVWQSAGDGLYYIEVPVNAPAGTKSIFADFGSGNSVTGEPGFARICEVQAFAPAAVPEPSTLAGLASAAAVGFFFLRRKK